MTTFDRFDAILNNRKPDKMPFHIYTFDSSVSSEILGRSAHTGGAGMHFREEASWLDGEAAHTEYVHQIHEDLIELNRKVEADVVREGWRLDGRPTKRIDECTLLFGSEDGPHVVKRFFPETTTYGVLEDTTQISSIEELEVFVQNQTKEETAVTEDELAAVYEDQVSMKALADPFFPMVVAPKFGGVSIPMYSEVWLEATALEPEMVRDYLLWQTEKALPHVEWLARKGFKWINAGGDIADNNRTVYSPDTFRRINLPSLKKIIAECNKYDVKYSWRTDGNIWGISDYLFKDAGVHAYGEVDRGAGMTVDKLRAAYPHLILSTNIQSVTLQNGTEQEVRAETSATLAESGGYNYIAGPSNAVMPGTPVRNIHAMVDEIGKYQP